MGIKLNLWTVLIAVSVVLLAAGGYVTVRGSRPLVETALVEEGTVVEFVDERAMTSLPVEYKLVMPFAGLIDPIEVEVGDAVQSEQVLVRISPNDLENEVEQAKAVAERLEASIAENDDTRLEETGYSQALKFVESFSYTLQAADARRKASEARMNYAETMLGRITRLTEQNAAAQEALDTAQLEFSESQQGYAQDNFVFSAVSAIDAAAAFLPGMVKTYIDKKKLSRAVLEKQLQEARAALAQSLLRQSRGVLKSPVDGVVLTRDFQTSQFLNAGTELLTVGDLGQLQIEAELLSQEAVSLKKGARVEIYGPVTGRELGSGLAGRVNRVEPAGFTKVSSLGVEQQRVKVVIDPDSSARDFLLERGVGTEYRTRVRIFSAEKLSTKAIPRTALFRSPTGSWQAFVVVRGKVRRRDLKIGLINDRVAEVLEGVELGETVVLAPQSNLEDGTAVRTSTSGT